MRHFRSLALLLTLVAGGIQVARAAPLTSTRGEKLFSVLNQDVQIPDCAKLGVSRNMRCNVTLSYVFLMHERLNSAKNFVNIESNLIDIPEDDRVISEKLQFFNNIALNDYFNGEALSFATCLENACGEFFGSEDRREIADRWRRSVLFISCIYNTEFLSKDVFTKRRRDTFDIYNSVLRQRKAADDFQSRLCLPANLDPGIAAFVLFEPAGNLPLNFKTKF